MNKDDEGADSLVLDPYVGSGTTALAAKVLGFDYVGMDINKVYLEYAQNRLKNYKDEIEKIEKERDLHTVKKTFAQRKKEGLYNPKQNVALFGAV